MLDQVHYFELESTAIQDGLLFIDGRSDFHPHLSRSQKLVNACRKQRRLITKFIAVSSLFVLLTIKVLLWSKKNRTPFAEFDENHGRSSRVWIHDKDLAFLPYGDELERSVCEEQYDDIYYTADLRRSETVRCYKYDYRWCFGDELPTDMKDNEFRLYNTTGHQFRFFEKDDVMYTPSGQSMPDSFNSQCSSRLWSEFWYSPLPTTGCGTQIQLRFCTSDGKVDWTTFKEDLDNFNCLEWSAVITYERESDAHSVLESICAEYVIGCAEGVQRSCINGNVDKKILDQNSQGCGSYFYMYDFIMMYENAEGLNLVCLR